MDTKQFHFQCGEYCSDKLIVSELSLHLCSRTETGEIVNAFLERFDLLS